MRNIVYLSLGTNMGDRLNNLALAVKALDAQENIKVEDTSSIYETEPVGYTDQASFLNIALKITTDFTPHQLLKATQKIEQELGRVRDIRWGPRIIDVDILLFNEEQVNTADLIIPHPRMTERGFVLIPLKELGIAMTGEQLQGDVKLWKQKKGASVFEFFENGQDTPKGVL